MSVPALRDLHKLILSFWCGRNERHFEFTLDLKRGNGTTSSTTSSLRDEPQTLSQSPLEPWFFNPFNIDNGVDGYAFWRWAEPIFGNVWLNTWFRVVTLQQDVTFLSLVNHRPSLMTRRKGILQKPHLSSFFSSHRVLVCRLFNSLVLFCCNQHALESTLFL